MDGQREYPFRAVIFDMDGVLVDSEMAYAGVLLEYGAHLGLPLTFDDVKGGVGKSFQEFCRLILSWNRQAGLGDATPEEAARRYMAWEEGHELDFAALLNPGVAETLAGLRGRGVRVALASSSPRATIDEALSACGIAGFFELVVSGEEFRESKPNPEIYLHTVERLGFRAWECCCVEDSVPGIAAGKAAGLYVVAKREERFGFSQDAADLIIDELPELLAL